MKIERQFGELAEGALATDLSQTRQRIAPLKVLKLPERHLMYAAHTCAAGYAWIGNNEENDENRTRYARGVCCNLIVSSADLISSGDCAAEELCSR